MGSDELYGTDSNIESIYRKSLKQLQSAYKNSVIYLMYGLKFKNSLP